MGDYESAIAQFHKSLQVNPETNPVTEHNLAKVFLHIGKFKEALEHFEREKDMSTHQAQDEIQYHLNCLQCFFAMHNYEETISRCKLVLEKDYSNVAAHTYWGLCLFNLGKFREAIDRYATVVSLDPENAGAENQWGVALYSLGQYDQAIHHFKLALALDNKDHVAYYNWGRTLFSLKNYTQAIELFIKSLAIEPKQHKAHHYWAEALYKMHLGGDLASINTGMEEALTHYKLALKLEPKSMLSHLHAGILLYRWYTLNKEHKLEGEVSDKFVKALQEALEHLESVCKVDEHNVKAITYCGEVLHSMERYLDQ